MSIATVVSVSGQAWARDAEGNLRELQQGDQLLDGETLVTSDSGAVQLDFADGLPPVAIVGGQQVAMSGDLDADEPVEPDEASAQDEGIDALLAALDGEGDLLEGLEATAAGGGDGAEGGGHSFIQLARIVESVDPLAFAFDNARGNNIDSELRGSPAFLDTSVVNVAPEASNDVFTTDEDTALSGANVLANDTDPEGDALTVTSTDPQQVTFTGPDGFTVTAEVTIDEDGNVSFNPAGDFDALGVGESATGTLTYTVSDGTATDTATVTLTVNGVNDAPTAGNDGTGAADDVFTTDEDTALSGANVLANDTDPEGDALTVTSTDPQQVTFTGPDGFEVTTSVTIAADGSVSFNPAGDFDALGVGESATGTLTYTVSDGTATDTATVTLTVNGVNDAPTAGNDGTGAADDVFTTDEDTALSGANVLANDTDPEGDALTVTSTDPQQVTFTGPDGFEVTTSVTIAADGSVSFNPSGNFDALGVGESATGTLTYTVSDGTATDTATVTLTVNGVNDAPTAGNDGTGAADDVFTTDEDTALSGANVLANDTDPENDALTVSDAGSRQVTFTGPDGFEVTTSVTIAADGSVSFNPSGNFDALGVGESATGTLTYTVSDGTATDTATVTLTVNGVNDAPTAGNDGTGAADDVFTTDEDTALSGANVLANDTDPEGDSLSVSDAGTRQVTFTGPDGFTATVDVIVADNGTVTFDPAGRFDALGVGESATGELSYEVTDGNGGTDTATVTLTVNGVNDAPTAGNDGTGAADDVFTTDEDTALSGANVLANDTDPEGDTLTVTSTDPQQVTFTGPDGFEVTTSVTIAADGSVSFNPSGNFDALGVGESATGTLTYTVSDGTATDTATVTLTVNGVNDAPASSDSQFTVQEDTAYTLDLDDFGHYTDIEGDALAAIEITSLPENGVLELSGEQVSAGDTIAISAIEAGDLVFVPDTNTDEDGAFGFRVQDAAGDWSQSTYQAAVVVEAIADTPEVAIQLGAPSELKDTLQYESKSLTFDAKLGDDKGDGNIDGNSSNYEESVSQTLSFGPQYAGQTVSLTLDVDIQGTWNQGWGVTDDYWQVLSGDEVLETFKYGSPLNEDVSGNVITNIAVVLDENGEVELSFRASTTEKSETVTINGATGEVAGTTYEVVTGYEYSIDVSAALQDRDGSESLSLLIEGVPEGATLSQGTDNGDGTWTLSVAPGEQDFATNLTMTTPANVNGGFTLTVKATATEASGGDLAVNTAMAVASAYEPGSPSLDAPSAEPIIAGYHGYVSGQGNGNNTGTYANNNGLKETSASNAEAIVSADGFYSVERNGNPHSETSDRIDPTEALVLELGQAVNSVTFEVQGNVGEAQWSVFAANGDRLGGGSALGEPNSEGFLTVSYDMPFSYIALDGGDDSAFAVKPIGVGIAGTASDDTLNGSAGDDTLIGGEGDDILYGQEGADVFAWQLGDEGQPGNPAQDTVKDFSLAEGDSLDLAELLVDEQPGSIDDYLHAAPSASGGDTILHVSTGGGFAGDYANNSGQENQTITLEGVSMGDQSSQEFINDLINNGNLNIDQ